MEFFSSLLSLLILLQGGVVQTAALKRKENLCFREMIDRLDLEAHVQESQEEANRVVEGPLLTIDLEARIRQEISRDRAQEEDHRHVRRTETLSQHREYKGSNFVILLLFMSYIIVSTLECNVQPHYNC